MHPTFRKHRAPRFYCWQPLEPLEHRMLLSAAVSAVFPADAVASTLTLLAPTKAIIFGQTVTLTGKLSAAGASVAKSSVSLMDLDTNSDLQDVKVSSSGSFKFTFTADNLAMHLAAVFGGTSLISFAQSTPLPLAALPAATTLSLKVDPSGTEVLAALNLPRHFSSNLLPDLTGTFSLLDSGQPVATVSMNANTSAIFDASAFSVGRHTLTLSYSGNDFFSPENLTTKLAIPPILATTTTVSVSSSPKVAAPVMLTAIVRPTAKGGWAVNGTATFYADGTELGTARVKGGVGKLSTKFLYPGDEQITADFIPTSPHLPSNSDPATASITEPNEIDVLALYTPQALAVFGSADNIRGIVQTGLDDTNQAFINSQIPAFTHLNAVVAEDYTESGSLDLDLQRLENPSDGFMDDAYSERALYGADLVVLVDSNVTALGKNEYIGGESTEFSGGSLYRSFIVIAGDVPEGQYVLPHEIGHTMGAGHAVGDPQPNGAAPYAHGYRFTAPDGSLYHDIMAYFPGTPILYYSNPNVTYEGVAVGTATANDARIMAQNAPTVSKYMTPKPAGLIQDASLSQIEGFVLDAAATGPITIRITVVDSTHLSDISVTLTASSLDAALTSEYGVNVYDFSFAPYLLSTTITHTASVYALDPLTDTYVLIGTRVLSMD